MLKRWLGFGLAYMLLGLPLMYMVVTSEVQGPWLVAFGIYFVLSALVGNWYVFFGTRIDWPTFFKWLAINVFGFGLIAVAYLDIVGVIELERLLPWVR